MGGRFGGTPRRTFSDQRGSIRPVPIGNAKREGTLEPTLWIDFEIVVPNSIRLYDFQFILPHLESNGGMYSLIKCDGEDKNSKNMGNA